VAPGPVDQRLGPSVAVRHPPNPIRSEADAFGFLLWFVGAVVVIVAVVALIEALT
jgi:hypothetical protein